MNTKSIKQAVALAALLTVAGQASAVTYDLCAGTMSKTMPDSSVVTMWGYGLDTGGPCTPTVPGPPLTVPVGDTTLTVNLRNELTDPVSMVISGQQAVMSPVFFTDGQNRQRVRSFTHETTTTTGVYSWGNFKPGTFLYSSGTHPAVQVQMGLYGAVTQDTAAGEAYGIPYDNEVTLLYSEIDPALHAAVAGNDYGPGMGTTSTVNYAPKYFLVNGAPFVTGDAALSAGAAGESTLVRLLNAGLEDHAMVLQGQHMNLVAEDGNAYPFPRTQHTVLMAAGKTKDAIFAPAANGTYPVYDRRLRSGMLTNLSVAAAVPGPTAVDDNPAAFPEDSSGNSISVLTNDTQAPSPNPLDPATVVIGSPAVNGQATANLDGTVSYTPNPDFSGADGFTYTVRDTLGTLSNAATVSITVTAANDNPVAVNDPFGVQQDSSGNVLDVLANDTDVDTTDTLTITAVGATSNGGTATTDGSTVTYTPAAGFANVETFTYDIFDGMGGSATATVTVTVNAVVNQAPVAVDDYDTVTRNTGNSSNSVTIDVAGNDTDAEDGTVVAATVTITSNPRKGIVVNNGNGMVTYTPAAGKRGSDAIGYTIEDNDGATSNQATVRVDILKN
jgi:hypothetical protein